MATFFRAVLKCFSTSLRLQRHCHLHIQCTFSSTRTSKAFLPYSGRWIDMSPRLLMRPRGIGFTQSHGRLYGDCTKSLAMARWISQNMCTWYDTPKQGRSGFTTALYAYSQGKNGYVAVTRDVILRVSCRARLVKIFSEHQTSIVYRISASLIPLHDCRSVAKHW